jgi:hypothetical protein
MVKMDLMALTIAILEIPILGVMTLEAQVNYFINGLLPQYFPSAYQFLANLPIPLVPWPNGPGPQ